MLLQPIFCRIKVTVRGPVDEVTGMVMDAALLKDIMTVSYSILIKESALEPNFSRSGFFHKAIYQLC